MRRELLSEPLFDQQTAEVGFGITHRDGFTRWLDHASRETHPFLSDPYIVQHRPRSILCIPLVTQGELVGVHAHIGSQVVELEVAILRVDR